MPAWNASVFDVLTPDSAWVLGLIFSDGHVRIPEPGNRQDGWRIEIYGSEVVCSLAALIVGFGGKIGRVKNRTAVLRLGSRTAVENLNGRYAIAGPKSHRIRMPLLMEDLMPHFVRGLWVGDGSLRRRGKKAVVANFATASLGLRDDIARVLEPVCGEVSKYDVGRNGKELYRVDVLRFPRACKFLAWLFAGSSDRNRDPVSYSEVADLVEVDSCETSISALENGRVTR